ncbi:hypothetical protein [Gemmobacter serpentinus]|uniref:hypothetical protein n=1 Tax=Gemmobacter serpentinus TaxID=2652247 RepID=UPI0018657A05|nr:hypothetical protein [Gemmobacter serpentinus]
MKKERRWLKSVIATAQDMQVTMPWQRGMRRRPAAMQSSAQPALAKPAVPAQALAAR